MSMWDVYIYIHVCLKIELCLNMWFSTSFDIRWIRWSSHYAKNLLFSRSVYFKLLGINIDRGLKFDFYRLKLCSKANRKLTLLSRMFKFLTFEKKRILIKAYFESQFKYCPFVWMFHRRQVNNKLIINNLWRQYFFVWHSLGKKFSVHDRNIQ